MFNWYKNMKINVKILISLILFAVIGIVDYHYVAAKSVTGIWNYVIILIGLAILFVLGFVVARSLSKPIIQLKGYVSELSLGKTDFDIQVKSNDELGQLTQLVKDLAEGAKIQAGQVQQIALGDLNIEVKLKSDHDVLGQNLNRVIKNLQTLIHEMEHMSVQHDAGEIDVVISTEKFQGDYQMMATKVNEMVNGHITVKKKAMATIAEFAEGNFDAPLEQFPGKKAFINHNIENLRENLKLVNSEIGRLITASKEGYLDERSDVTLFKGDWASLMGGLNGLIDAIIEPIQEASDVLSELSKGHLNSRVQGNYKGDHAKIKQALNETMNTLSEYIQEISHILTQMAEGNLNVKLTKDYRGDFTSMKEALNLIIQSFNELLHEISHSSSQVAAGSKQVSDSAQELAHGATEQASSLEQLSASVEEIASQTQLNATSANEANQLADQAQTNALQGNDQMQKMLGAMDGINESSSNISKIIKVIDEMAFQTNILALNAAVEAARAGQHGKGFAVVAEEVRNLAARSANAAKETTVLIEGSIGKVEDGMKIANHTADALNKIVGDVAKAAELVGQIARASNEQAVGINQINQGLTLVSNVTQTNSATSEESAAASEELTSQAEGLRKMVGRFQLKTTYSPTAPRAEKKTIDPFSISLDQNQEDKYVIASEEVAVGRDSLAFSSQDFGKY